MSPVADPQERPWRSMLYIPGSKARALDKARGLPADAIIFDLEDAVTPEEKPAARATLTGELRRGGYGHRARIVRINGLDTPWGRDDLAACADLPLEGVLIPKVGTPGDVQAVADLLAGVPLWVMMETPAGILNAAPVAAHPRVAGFVLGTNDLAKDIGARTRADRLPLMQALQTCLLAARAAGIVCVDGVYNAFRDADGLRAECEQGRDLGFDGKTLIHPAQIDIANAAFAPSPEEIALAERQIAAFAAAASEGRGIAVVDGKIVENLHIVVARQVLARAGAIAALQASKD